ncbi:MAG: cation-transporting ATPase [Flavipsychrobacter sp.]|nr:cation-transporting ATPase [Flavipsychrobacter sp.]
MKIVVRNLFAVLLFCFALFWRQGTHAQFSTAYVSVNGLTCSQCSRTVELKLRKLDFVADVQMNLQHTEAKIILKKDKKTDIDKIAQAVIDAGFSVGSLRADLDMTDIAFAPTCFNYNDDQYVFMFMPAGKPTGVVTLSFFGKKYMTKAALKSMQFPAPTECGSLVGKKYFIKIAG